MCLEIKKKPHHIRDKERKNNKTQGSCKVEKGSERELDRMIKGDNREGEMKERRGKERRREEGGENGRFDS